MQFPKISIVTPSFNQGRYLEQTMLSVIGQGYPNLEYVVIDGGSTDNSVEIIRKYEKHLTYWVSESDNGQSAAINKGFGKCTGDIFAWLNSDDIYMPGCLHYMADVVQKSGNGIYFGNTIHFKESEMKGLQTYGSNVVKAFQSKSLGNFDYIIQPSSFWTREVWLQLGPLDETLHYGFDWAWFLRASLNNKKFFPLEKTLSLYRIHASHKTGTGGQNRQNEILQIYKTFAPKYARLYELILSEQIHLKSKRFRMVKMILRISRTRNSYAHVLKVLKQKKYSAFSADEINACREML